VLSYEGRNRHAENMLRTIQFDNPEWTPCSVGFLPATWMKHREALEDVCLAHPRVFRGFKKGGRDFEDMWGQEQFELGRHTDCWGVVWDNIERGVAAHVKSGPLEDWSAFESWTPPDPMTQKGFGGQPDWDEVRERLDAAKARGRIATAYPVPHGFMYMTLTYLRGFGNYLCDIAVDDLRIRKLTSIVEDYMVAVTRKYLGLGVEYLHFGEDLGLQTALPMSPEMWRQWVKPSYEAIMGPCRDADVPVYLHTDGHVLEIIPDLIDVGVRVLNPQIGANGLDGLEEMAKGKVAIHLDLDRQMFPFVTPSEIEDHVGEAFERLYDKRGGLMLLAECGPDVPLENIHAICRSYERLCNLPEA